MLGCECSLAHICMLNLNDPEVLGTMLIQLVILVFKALGKL